MRVKGLISAILAAAIFMLSFVAVQAVTMENYTADDGTEYKYYYKFDTDGEEKLVLLYVSSPSKDIVIPDNINDITVAWVNGAHSKAENSTQSIVFPETCKGIGGFSNYKALRSVTAEGFLEYIGGSAFSGCENLETVTLNGVKEICPRAFEDCTSLKTVSSLDGLIAIRDHAFTSSGIREIKLPSTLQIIEKAAFHWARNLKSITIPENVTVIPHIAFQESGLERVEFEGNISFMGATPFGGCENLRTVTGLTQDQIVKFWDAFYETPFQTEMTDEAHPFVADSTGYLAAYVGTDTEVEIPSTVKTIGDKAFAGKPITSVTIPSSVTTIGDKAFYGCEGLTSITIPTSVTLIKELAFSHCKNLKNITFEASDKQLAISTAAFQLTAVTEDTLNTNGRRYTNQKSAFKNTALDTDFAEPSDTMSVPNVSVSVDGQQFQCDGIQSDEVAEDVENALFMEFLKNNQELPYVSLGDTIELSCQFESDADRLTVYDYILWENGGKKYSITPESFDVELDDGHGQFKLEKNLAAMFSSDSHDYERGAVIRGFSFSVECENRNYIYAFAVRTDASETVWEDIEPQEIKVKTIDGQLEITANENIIEFPDAKPFIDENGRTQIPVRAVSEALGAKVAWDSGSQRVSINGNGVALTLTIGSDVMAVNGIEAKMDTKAVIIDERTYIPIRYVAEAMGMTVVWE